MQVITLQKFSIKFLQLCIGKQYDVKHMIIGTSDMLYNALRGVDMSLNEHDWNYTD